ncbi:MAG: WG repeat-containing protein, partial [Lachnospiraceae bacterium]|nr:WG repeat-containing protein [Lachnospiraceae bacterium]
MNNPYKTLTITLVVLLALAAVVAAGYLLGRRASEAGEGSGQNQNVHAAAEGAGETPAGETSAATGTEGATASTREPIAYSGYTVAVPFEYDNISAVEGAGFFGWLSEGGTQKYTFFDTAGQVAVAPREVFFDNVAYVGKGFAAVIAGVGDTEKYGVADLAGNEIIPLKYDRIYDIGGYSGLFMAGIANDGEGRAYNWGALDLDGGRELTPIIYDSVRYCGPNHVTVGSGLDSNYEYGRWAVLDRSGAKITSTAYDTVGWFSDGMLPVNVGGGFEVEGGIYVGQEGGKWG